MKNLLAFDSIFIINPIRWIYLLLVRKMMNVNSQKRETLIVYRLDKKNIFIRDKSNISDLSLKVHKDYLDAKSIEFYRFLSEKGFCQNLLIKNQKLYDLYTRQLKLKLAGVLRCTYRVYNFSKENNQNIEIVSDTQTIAMIKLSLEFLNLSSSKIIWKSNTLLTTCITLNSFIMRSIALIRMLITPSSLPREYFYKFKDPNRPTVLVTMPKRRPEDFFKSYVSNFEKDFNVIFYSIGFLQEPPLGYKQVKVKRKLGIIQGIFRIKSLCFSAESYIADILMIFKNHSNLNLSIDAVNSVYANKIDVHISRLQTNVVDLYLANEARRRGIFVLGDIMEEIFYCNSVICATKSDVTPSLNLSLSQRGKIVYKGSNSLIKYRLSNFSKKVNYLNKLTRISSSKKIIFYASDPSKEESQRYVTEKFLMRYFSNKRDLILVLKTHTQDDGRITNYAYIDSGRPSNIFLIGDSTQEGKLASHVFKVFQDFDFNAAVDSCHGFLTTSSSSILQALALEKKAGIIDLYSNGYYDYLTKSEAAMHINDHSSLDKFLHSKNHDLSEEVLSYCGLNTNIEEFDMAKHIEESLKDFKRNP